jgi:hypothetical protein
MGDRLKPEDVTASLAVAPTLSCRRGEIFKRSRGHEVRGRTGLWLLSSEAAVQSHELTDHLTHLQYVLEARDGEPIERLRAVMQRDDLRADVTCF